MADITVPLEGLKMVDVLHPADVEIRIRQDGKVVWVNVNGICRLRTKIDSLRLIDERLEVDPTE